MCCRNGQIGPEARSGTSSTIPTAWQSAIWSMTAVANPQTACNFEAVRLLHSGSDHSGCGVRREWHAGSPEQTREYVSGNICRCGAYVGIVAAIKDVAIKMWRTET